TSVSRCLSGSVIERRIAEAVPDTPDGVDRIEPERPVDLHPEVPDVDVDEVRVAVVREVPYVLDEYRATEHLTRVTHEVFQQRELLARELDAPTTAEDLMRRRIQRE